MKPPVLAAAIAFAAALGATALAQNARETPPGAAPAAAGPAVRGEALYKERCATCHDAATDRTPGKAQLASKWADEIVAALKTGVMTPMASGLSDADIAAIATYLTGNAPGGPSPAQLDPPACKTADKFSMAGPSWNGWSPDYRNHRFQTDPGLKAADVPKLKVKWSFAYIGGRYGQPTIVGGRLFLTSSSGKLYSLDAKTGCMHWTLKAPTGVRTTVTVGKSAQAPSGYAAYFGDYQRSMYAVDAASGKQLWKTQIETHPRGVLTGTPVLYEGRLYVPVSTWEEIMGSAAAYECCTARGSLVAMDPATGQILWKTYMIEQAPKPYAKNAAGTDMYGPAGAAIWSAPTIDPKRGLIYVATGDSFTDVDETSSDAVIALEMATGKVRWKNQVTKEDNYLSGCSPTRRMINCPKDVGPDHDFGASPILIPLAGGKDVLLAGQKSGALYGLDPDTGRQLWMNQVGGGGALGGIEWGMATDGKTVYVANADPFASDKSRPALLAVDPATGKELWRTASPKAPCGWTGGSRCVNSNSAAPTLIPGAVLATTIDGRVRSYDPKTGAIGWTFDTAGQKYDTINGVRNQGGGALDVGGPTLAGGMMFLISGYTGNMGGVPNNVLLAFSVDGK